MVGRAVWSLKGAENFRARGKPPCPTIPNTIQSTARKKSPASSTEGQRVKLEAIRIGGHWATSREALNRFTARLTPRENNSLSSVESPTQIHALAPDNQASGNRS